MDIQSLDIEDVKLITPRKHGDDRGFFMETFRHDRLVDAIGGPIEFKQSNHSYSKAIHTVRGLHFQKPPFDQAKLVRCLRGLILDVVVDVREGSPTYGQHVKAVLSPENAQHLFVPSGFLHGFATLKEDTEILYECSNYYSPECDGSVMWNDPVLDIDWGIDIDTAVLSQKDANAPTFTDFKTPFPFI